MVTRFLHTADWQIGMKGSGLGAAGARVSAQRIETLGRIFETARERRVALILACGDLFESNEIDEETVSQFATAIGRFPDIAVHAIPGNHDVPGPGSVWNRGPVTALPNLYVHRCPEVVELEGLVLHTFPVASRYSVEDPLAGLPDLTNDSRVQVAMAHGHLTTVTFGVHEDDIRLPIDPRHVSRAGLDYLALGHWHGTRLERSSDGCVRIAYPGTHEQTSHRETDAGNVLLVEIEDKGAEPSVTPVRVGVFRWRQEGFAFAEDTTLDRFLATLGELKAEFLEMDVSGELPVGLYPHWCEAVESARENYLDFRVRDEGLHWRHDEDVPLEVADASLENVMQRLRTEAGKAGPEEQPVLREAIGLLGRLIREIGT